MVASTSSPPASDATTRRGASRAECRTVRSLRCGRGSRRLPGRTPGSGGFCARRPTCFSCSTPSLVLVTVLSARRPSCAVSTFGYEWWDTVANNAATVCCSCRNHERRRRCLRRFAAPSPSTIRGRQLDSAMKTQRTTKCSQTCLSLCGGGGSDARLMTCVFPNAIVDAPNWGGRTPGSQTPGVPATPSPRRRRTLRHRGLKNGHSRPAGRSAKKATKCGKITPPQNLNILSMNSSEAPPGTAGKLSLHEHSDVHNLVELRHGHLSLHTRACQQPCPELNDCNVGARLSSPRLHSATGPAQQGHRSPCQCTATGEFL